MTTTDWLGADEAAARLGVKPATLYAYVSRGQLRRRTGPDGRRSEYHPQDVADLAVRGRRARPTRPSDIIVPTAVTSIDRYGPSYRGRRAVELAGAEPFEVVAAWLWHGGVPAASADVPASSAAAATPAGEWGAVPDDVEVARGATAHLHDTAPSERLLPAIAALRSTDPLRGDLRAEVVVSAARRMLTTVASLVSGRSQRDATVASPVGGRSQGGATVAQRLAGAVTDPPGGERSSTPAASAPLIDAALVLLADHELAASTLAVRVAASARCDPYAAVLAGLAVLSGPRHGAASRPLELAMAQIGAGATPAAALERQLRDDAVPGFGHPLYRDGDPRAARLVELLEGSGFADRLDPMHAVLALGRRRGLPPPNIDAALAGLTHAIGAPPGTGELLFSIARMAGWVAHALEQYGQPRLLRPTGVYVGDSP